MASVNKVIIVGHLGRDPETRYSSTGDAICNIAVATSESWKDKNSGEKKEQTEWHRIVLYRKLGEIASQYLKKGAQVYIEGRLNTRKWTDKDDVERYTTEIIASDMRMLNSRQDGQHGGQSDDDFNYGQNQQRSQPRQQSNGNASRQQSNSRPQSNFSDMDDDIPFANPYRGKYCYAV